jgi:hypothetical protein
MKGRMEMKMNTVDEMTATQTLILTSYDRFFNHLESDLCTLVFIKMALGNGSLTIPMTMVDALFQQAMEVPPYHQPLITRFGMIHYPNSYKIRCAVHLDALKAKLGFAQRPELPGDDFVKLAHAMLTLLETPTPGGWVPNMDRVMKIMIVEHFEAISFGHTIVTCPDDQTIPMLMQPVVATSSVQADITWSQLLPTTIEVQTILNLLQTQGLIGRFSEEFKQRLENNDTEDVVVDMILNLLSYLIQNVFARPEYRFSVDDPFRKACDMVPPLVRHSYATDKVDYTRRLFCVLKNMAEDIDKDDMSLQNARNVVFGIVDRMLYSPNVVDVRVVLAGELPYAVCDAAEASFDASPAEFVSTFKSNFLTKCHAEYLKTYGATNPTLRSIFRMKCCFYTSILKRNFARNPSKWNEDVDHFTEHTIKEIIDDPDRISLARSLKDPISVLTSTYGDRQVSVYAPCWWHATDIRNRKNRARRIGCIWAGNGVLRIDDDTRLNDDMSRFSRAVIEYADATGTAIDPTLSTPARLTELMTLAFATKRARCEHTGIPSRAEFVTDERKLTLWEFAAVYFFTTAEAPGMFSMYTMFRSTLEYKTVHEMKGNVYVRRIGNLLLQWFNVALHKCPPVNEIYRLRLVPDGSRFLHRFITVPQAMFNTYAENAVGARVTFYCFQSFSLNLSPASFYFAQPNGDRRYLILLRIVINEQTTARFMSHLSAVETENEVLALPCMPYTIDRRDEIQDPMQFADFIFHETGFYARDIMQASAPCTRYLIITLVEHPLEEILTRDKYAKPLNG